MLLFVKIGLSIFPFDVWDKVWVLIRPVPEVYLLLYLISVVIICFHPHSTFEPVSLLSLIPRDVLDEIWDLIESVSEDFPTYSCN